MTASLFLDNLLAWSAQIGILVAAAALAALTLQHPRARLVLWQGLLAIALLLPAVEPWTQPAPEAAGAVSIVTGSATLAPNPPHTPGISWKRDYALFLIALGAMVRTLWIMAGLVRLRRIRLEARPLVESVASLFSSPLSSAPSASASVRWYVSDAIPGPVTFGWLRPAIVLPMHVLDFPADLRTAIAFHELEHVRRHDWLFVLAEEMIRSALWFHPAIWFVLSRIQLAREQVVDLEVVRLTQDRERYLDALLAVAAHKIERKPLYPSYAGSDVAPAPLFLKKRQLAVRVAAVMKETSMSKSRFVASSVTVLSAALAAARLAVLLFPLQTKAQTLPDSPGVTVDAGAALLHRAPVVYPLETRAMGTVMIDATVNARGEVTDARVLTGPDELRKEALASVLQWHYSTETGVPPEVRVAIRKFGPVAADPPPAPPASRVTSGIPVKPAEAPALPRGFDPTFYVDPASVVSEFPVMLKTISIRGLNADAEQDLRNRLPIREGSSVGFEDIARAFKVVDDFDHHLRTTLQTAGKGEVSVLIRASSEPPSPPDSPAGAGAAPPAPGVQRIRVGGNLQAASLITKITPVYPPEAKAQRIQGKVRFTATIGKDGTIQSLDLVSGPPPLVAAATEAVKQWVYRPTVLNGEAVEVVTLIDINFTLRDPQ